MKTESSYCKPSVVKSSRQRAEEAITRSKERGSKWGVEDSKAKPDCAPLGLLAAESTLAALAKEMAAEYQDHGSKWPRGWMQKHSRARIVLNEAREILIQRAEAANS